MSKIGSEIVSEKQASFENLTRKRVLWDRSEELFFNQLSDLASLKANSQIFDPKLSTLTIERGYRVAAQLPVGKVKGISTNDMGDAKLKNLLLDKYVIPNANAQFDFLTKLRMIDIYSNVYGAFYALIDQDIKPNGYIGPDMWLLNIRDVFPQVGAVGNDSDSIIIRTWKPISYFKKLRKEDGFTNISKIVADLEKLTGSKHNRDAENITKREQDQYTDGAPPKGKGYFEVLTRFERDRWVDVCVDADNTEFRDQKNPHDDGDIPVVCKYSMPLLEDPMGMSDFERGGTMQNLINGIWNMYADGVKMSIFPPVIINKDNVASPSSFKNLPGQKWLARNQVNNVALPLPLSPQGISTFQSTYQVANAALLNMFGTTDTATTSQVDPGFGKTPEALKQQSQRENTRDNADRFYMEQFINKTMKKFVNLISKKQTRAISFRMFPEEIEEIAREYPEIKDSYDENTGKLTVKGSRKKNLLYDYEIVSGSTYAVDQKTQQQNLTNLLQMFMQGGDQLQQRLMQEGYQFKFGELFKRVVANSGIQDWDKILQEMTVQEKGDNILGQDEEAFMQAIGGMQGGINQVPPQPMEQQMVDQSGLQM